MPSAPTALRPPGCAAAPITPFWFFLFRLCRTQPPAIPAPLGQPCGAVPGMVPPADIRARTSALSLGQRVAVWALEPGSVSRGRVLPAVALSLCRLWTSVGTVTFDLFHTSSFLLGLQEAPGPVLCYLLRGLAVSPACPPTRAGTAGKITDGGGVEEWGGHGSATSFILLSWVWRWDCWCANGVSDGVHRPVCVARKPLCWTRRLCDL